MAHLMTGNGIMGSRTAKVSSPIKMGRLMKASGATIKHRDMASIRLVPAVNIGGSGLMMRRAALVLISCLMDPSIWESFWAAKSRALDSLSGLMEPSTQGNGTIISFRDMGFISGVMVEYTRDSL